MPGTAARSQRAPTSLRRRLVTGVLVGGLLPLALGVAVLGWRSWTDARARAGALAQEKADAGAQTLSRLLHDLRYQLLLAANDSSLREWYAEPDTRDATRPTIEGSMVLLYDLQPDLIDEACFIDGAGPELARMVRGKAAPIGELSPDESGRPFFTPTFEKRPGEVYQGAPYVSPDSGRWVIPTATPISFDGEAVALLHFEVSLDGVRAQLAAALGADVAFRVVDAASGSVLIDGLDPAPIADAPFRDAGPWESGSALASASLTGVPGDLKGWTVEIAVPRAAAIGSGEMRVLGALLLVSLVTLWLWSRSVAGRVLQPVRRAAWASEGLAAGDLTRRIGSDRSDELGQMAHALDEAASRMSGTIAGMAGSAGELSDAAADLTRASTATATASSGTAEAASIAMREAAAVSEGVASAEGKAMALRARADRIADGAGEVLRVAADAVTAMGEASEVIGRLDASSAEIGDVVALIEAVADQTRLLALNASIEAARAGAAGKGFSVVADEVKSLATETQAGVVRIRGRIEAIQADAEASRRVNERAAATVAQIEQRQREIGGEIDEQVAVVHAMQSTLSEVARTTQAIDARLRSVAGAAAESSEEAALVMSAAVQLEQMSQTLRASISRFHFERPAAAAQKGSGESSARGPAPRSVVEAGAAPAPVPAMSTAGL